MKKVVRITITLAMVCLAILAGRWLWTDYLHSPWTRDGRIRADIVTIAPDVSGWVSDLSARNNAQVKQGDILFQVDSARYQSAVAQAQARLEQKQIALSLAQHQLQRRTDLPDAQGISQETLESYRLGLASAKADLALAQAELDAVRLDLERTRVTAPVTGTVINLNLRQGNYVSRGVPVISIVRENSFYVTGYFEETKLDLIRVGQKARITLMDGDRILTGRVTGIGRAISDRNSDGNSQLLPEVQQTFNWVRLAQRIPVDIAIDQIPENVRLSAGMTASIDLLEETAGRK